MIVGVRESKARMSELLNKACAGDLFVRPRHQLMLNQTLNLSHAGFRLPEKLSQKQSGDLPRVSKVIHPRRTARLVDRLRNPLERKWSQSPITLSHQRIR